MPSDKKPTRKLAAILFTDIVGYTAMMQSDEGNTLNRLKHYQQILQNYVNQYNGEIIKNYGDGSLCLFPSVLDAVQCAKEVQVIFRQEPRIPLRVGLHIGDVVYQDNDIYGDALNISSRIESMGLAGSIMMSKNVYDKVKNQPDLEFTSLGSFEFKNIEEPMEVFALANDGFVVPKASNMTGKGKPVSSNSILRNPLFIGTLLLIFATILYFALNPNSKRHTESVANNNTTVTKQKSIAVLPLKNLSGQADLEYVCFGMTDAIISRLTRISDMDKVSSFTSVSKYKDVNMLITEIAEELGVSYLVQGNFQKSGDQFKIALQLIEGDTDTQIWSDDYTGKWEPNEIFNIQANVTEIVAEKMNAQITKSEIASIQKMPTESKEAYNMYLLAEYQRHKSNELTFSKALPLYEEAISIDPNFVEAYSGLADIWSTGGLVWGIYDQKEAWANAKAYLETGLNIDSNNFNLADGLFGGSFYYEWNFEICEPYFQKLLSHAKPLLEDRSSIDYANKTGRHNDALRFAKHLIDLRTTYGLSYFSKAEALYYLGKKEEALQILKDSDPLFSDNLFYLRETARYYYYMQEYGRFKTQLSRIMNNFTDRPPIVLWMNAVNHAMDGEADDARIYLDQLVEAFQSGKSGSPGWFTAMYYFAIGDVNSGFDWLEKSYKKHEVEMTWLQTEPLLQNVKSDPRYISIYQQMGWPEFPPN